MFFRQIFEAKLAQYAYIIGCQRTGEALVIDPQRDIGRYVSVAESEGLRIVAATETHIHADFLSGVREFAHRFGVTAYLSAEGGPEWSYDWAGEDGVRTVLLRDGDTFEIGNIHIQVMHTPGHTPEHVAFAITDVGGGASEPMGVASGDFVFVGDLGRPDLLETAAGQAGAMEPSARRLYASARAFLELPDYLQIWPGHGAGSACGKALGAVPESTVGYERRFSPALEAAQGSEEGFVRFILEGQPEPPAYFARMKRQNREGPPLLGEVTLPERLEPTSLAPLSDRGAVIVDARLDRGAFMAGHLPGSLYAPLDKTFSTIVGSYASEDQDIVLVVESGQLQEALLDLMRIGLDRVVGYVEPTDLDAMGPLASTEVIDMVEVERRRVGQTVLDVRRATEFAEGHVPGALNIAHTRLGLRLAEVPSDRPVLVYCRSGARAAAAAALLQREGIEVVYVDDHFERWVAQSDSVVGLRT